jgi:integrase
MSPATARGRARNAASSSRKPPAHLRLPIALAMFAGFRKADVLTMSRAAVKDGMIAVRTSKRGVEVSIPVHPALRDAMEAHDTTLGDRRKNEVQLCLNSYGEKWTESGYNSSFGKFIATLEAEGKVAKGLTMHGLRHTLGTRLSEGGASNEEIMTILGQKSPAMARHYSEGAETSEKTKGLVLSLDPRKKK